MDLETNALKATQLNRPYTKSKYTQEEYMDEDENVVGSSNPNIDMKRYKDLFHSIPLYFDKNLNVSEIMVDQAGQLAWIFNNLAQQVFKIPVETIHLYQYINGGKNIEEIKSIAKSFYFRYHSVS